MFTGIIADIFLVEFIQKKEEFCTLKIQTTPDFCSNLQIGASICVEGVCLTVTKDDHGLLSFDVIAETLEKTTLGQLKVGSFVNLERSLTFGSEIGGHLLTGHVSTVAEITGIKTWEGNQSVEMAVEAYWAKYLIEKTHMAIDGISLTIVQVSHKEKQSGKVFFSTHLIPETLSRTSLGKKRVYFY